MLEASGYDECVGVTRSLMRALGVWPGEESKTQWYERYQFLVSFFFMVFFIIIPQTKVLLAVWGNLNMVIEILTTADIMVGLACIKLLGIWYNKKGLKYLLMEIEKDWRTTKYYQKTVMWGNVRTCRFIIKNYVILTFGTIVVYALRGLLLIRAYDKHTNNSYNTYNMTYNKPMFVNSEFFFKTNYSPMFEFVWASQFLAAAIGVGAFVAFDGFFIFSILHLCAQFTNLQVEMKKLNFLMHLQKYNFTESLILIVNRHLQLNRFTNSIEDNFNKVFLVQMICYSITLCLQGYQLVIALTENSTTSMYTLAFIVIFTAANILSLFIYCYVANKLDTECLKIFDSAYEINWYKLKTNESKMVLIILQVARFPIKLTAGKFAVLSYKYFTQVLKTSGGYLSMLLAMKSRL